MWDTSQVVHQIYLLLFVCSSVFIKPYLVNSTTDTHERSPGGPISKGIRLNLTYMQVNAMQHRILVLTDVDYKEKGTTVVKFRCHHPSTVFCDKNWKELQDCKRIQSNSADGFLSCVCMLNQHFIVYSTLEVQATIKIGNMSATKLRNFSIAEDKLGLVTDLRGEGVTVNDLLVKWTDGSYPAVVWDLEKQVKQKTVKLKYWEKIPAWNPHEEDFHLGFRERRASLRGLKSFTEYCFQAKYRFKFEFGKSKNVKPGYVIELGWSNWSDQACAWTLGVPLESINITSCNASRTANVSLLHLEYKLPPKQTWNGKLLSVRMRIYSMSMTTIRTKRIAHLCINCSRTLTTELTNVTPKELSVAAALCTKGGCSGSTLSRCRWLGISSLTLEKDHIVAVFLYAVVSLIVIAVIGASALWFKRHKGRSVSLVSFDTAIDPVTKDYDVPVDPPHNYYSLTDVVPTSQT